MKIFAKIVILFFCLCNFSLSSANMFDGQINQAESLLGKEKWNNYKMKIDISLEKISGNEEILLKKIKESEIKYKGENEKIGTTKSFLLQYIKAKLEEKIAENEALLLKKEIEKNQAQINKDEKEEAEKTLLKIEEIIKKKADKAGFENIFQTRKNQSGKVALSFSSGQNPYNGTIQLDNLNIKQQERNIQINSFVNIDLKDSSGETKLKAFFDVILKDKNFYYFVDKLEILKESKQVNPNLEMLKKLEKKNSYIKQTETSNFLIKSIINTLGNINKQKIFFSNFFSKKVYFESYKKEKGGNYRIIPTKNFCNFLKSYSQNNEQECSEKELFDLIKPFVDGTIKLQINLNKNISNFSLSVKEKSVSIDATAIFSQDDIEKISLIITPDKKIFPSEEFSFYYKKYEKMTMKLNSYNGKLEGNIFIIFDQNNTITSGNGNIKNSFLKGNFEIKEKIISGNFKIEDFGKEKISGIISGKIDKNNAIELIQINFGGKAFFSQKDGFNGKWIYNKNSNSVNITYQEENQNKISCKLDFDITTAFGNQKIEVPKNVSKGE